MTSRYRHRRSSNPATAFPAPLEPGEIAVNTANRQIAAGDVADGSPHDLIAVRFFDTHAIYKINDIVDYNGNLYRAAVANGPGAFNGANWTANGTQVFFGDTAPSPAIALDGSFFWETDSGTLFVLYNDGNSRQWVIASPQPDPSTFVLRAGDTMGGSLTLAGDPTTPMMAATKQYADAQLTAAKAYADAGDVTTGNAGAAAVALKVAKAGDTMTGPLVLPGNAATALQAVPKQQLDTALLAAAPLDAMAYNGFQVNGSFEVSQERPPSTAFTANGYLCDGWGNGYNTGVVSAQVAPFPATGLGNILQLNVTTPDPAMTGTSISFVYNAIEGYRVRRLAFGGASAQPVTVAFWSAHHRPGLYSVSLRNADATRSCVVTYTQAVADAWQYNVVTFPGCPDGVWNGTNGLGMQLAFANASSATYTAPAAGNWYNANYVAAPGQVNGVGTTADVFRLACVLALPGIFAPTSARSTLITRPYDEELLLCRRYWWCSNPDAPHGLNVGLMSGYSLSANSINLSTYRFTVPMRIIPAIQVWNNGVFGQVRNSQSGALTATGTSANSYAGKEGTTYIITGAAMSLNQWLDFDMVADARL